MGSNAFGTLLKITTWGESHGPAMGVVLDGCPAGIAVSEETIAQALAMRSPGNSPYTSPRKEPDHAQIMSGVFQGKTTGASIAIIIHNKDADPKPYEDKKHLLRPGHANFTYIKKYGVYDYRGGGRASARETACRVAAAGLIQPWLQDQGVSVVASLKQVGSVAMQQPLQASQLDSVKQSPIFCADPVVTKAMMALLDEVKADGDSIGGVVEFCIEGLPIGLGDPVYEKLSAKLAAGMMSLPATKGFELGEGFHSATMRGSEHNDAFTSLEGQTSKTNHAGGLLGGISTGMPVVGRVAFKPTASIKKTQDTLDVDGNCATIRMSNESRHDPCVAIRAVPVVSAMAVLTVADALLMHRCAKAS